MYMVLTATIFFGAGWCKKSQGSHASRKGGQLRTVLQLLGAMQQRRLQANMMRFNAIVHASIEGSARW